MRKTHKKKKPISAEQIARMADRGMDISRFFIGGKMMNPIQRVNVDFTAPMLAELDDAADELNISRQAVIKTLLREGLDRRQSRRLQRTRPRRNSRHHQKTSLLSTK